MRQKRGAQKGAAGVLAAEATAHPCAPLARPFPPQTAPPRPVGLHPLIGTGNQSSSLCLHAWAEAMKRRNCQRARRSRASVKIDLRAFRAS